MKFTIDRNVLQRELAFVQSVVERRSMIPVLANVLIESLGKESIRITGTDLDVTITATASIQELTQEGAMCVQARKLFDIARLLPDGPVTFTKEENSWVVVEAGKSTFKLPGIDRETFPELPKFKDTPLSITAGLLTSLIQQSIFAITQEEGRYTLSGAKFEISNKRTRVVTTDGHRLALVETNGAVRAAAAEPLEVLIPRKTLAELIKVCAGYDGDVNFGADENHIYFQVGNRTVISRLLAGLFPNYEMVLPKHNDNSATFDRVALSQALKRMSLMAEDRSKGIVLDITAEQTTVSAQSQTDGEGTEIIQSKLNGTTAKIGLNANYLQDVLNVLTSEEVVFTFKDANTQTELRPAIDDSTSRFIIMPLRID